MPIVNFMSIGLRGGRFMPAFYGWLAHCCLGPLFFSHKDLLRYLIEYLLHAAQGQVQIRSKEVRSLYLWKPIA